MGIWGNYAEQRKLTSVLIVVSASSDKNLLLGELGK